jgi:hypothetical protein
MLFGSLEVLGVVVLLLGLVAVEGAVWAAAMPLSARPATASAIKWRFICPPCQTCEPA